jgi:hypothetical protein
MRAKTSNGTSVEESDEIKKLNPGREGCQQNTILEKFKRGAVIFSPDLPDPILFVRFCYHIKLFHPLNF